MTAPTLTGPVQALTGHVEPNNDEVIAVFRNGKLHQIYGPGGRARALWLRYRPGTLTYARILRSDISIEHSVVGVAVQEGWLLPRVSVQTLVALNPVNDYAALRDRLEERGLQFMAALTAELEAEMSAFVRRIFAPRTHAEVLADPTPPGFGAREVLLHGLFVVDSVYVKHAEADPQFAQLRTAVQGRIVDVEENARSLANADIRGLSLYEYENPELVQLKMQQHHELAMAAGQQFVDLERLKVEAQRDQLDFEKAALAGQAAVGVETVRNIGAVTRATKSGAVPELSGLLRGLDGRQEPIVVPHSQDGEVLAPRGDLNRDPRLMAEWKRAGGPRGAVDGLIRVEDDGAVLLLLALERGVADTLDLGVLLGQAFPGEDVVVLPDSDSLLVWVQALVRERVPHIEDLQPVFTLEEREGVLRILVGSQNGRAGKVVKAVLEPTTLIIPALCALCPGYDDVTCTPALV